MLEKLYVLESDCMNGVFLSYNKLLGQDAMGQCMDQNWQPFDLTKFRAPILELYRSSVTRKRNFKLDICTFSTPFCVFSEKAIEALRDILEPRGQILPVITASKRKKFFGYYPTNLIDCFDRDYEKAYELGSGLWILADKLTDEYLFCVPEFTMLVFVTDKFEQRVKEAELVGFTFEDSNRVGLKI